MKSGFTIPDGSTWERVDAERSEALTARLHREMNYGHQLYPLWDEVTVIAADGATDDVLVTNADGTRHWVVHLMWGPTCHADDPFTLEVSHLPSESVFLR